jgi:hypothetical protein
VDFLAQFRVLCHLSLLYIDWELMRGGWHTLFRGPFQALKIDRTKVWWVFQLCFNLNSIHNNVGKSQSTLPTLMHSPPRLIRALVPTCLNGSYTLFAFVLFLVLTDYLSVSPSAIQTPKYWISLLVFQLNARNA